MKQSETLAVENENRQSLMEQISSLTSCENGESQNLVIPKAILKFTNHDLKTATFLSNLIYWSEKGETDNNSIDRSASEWYEETGLDWMDIHEAQESREVINLVINERYENNEYWQFKLDKKALIKALQDYLESDRNRIAYYMLKEDYVIRQIKRPITYHELLCFSRFFDEKLEWAISTRLEMHPDYLAKNYKKRHRRDPQRFSVEFPISRWIKICDAFSEMFNKAEGDSYHDCIVNEHCAEPSKYDYCKNCFRQYI